MKYSMFILPLLLYLIIHMFGCSTNTRSSLRCMLYQGTPMRQLFKMYPNYCIVKLEGTNLLFSLYINRSWQEKRTNELSDEGYDLFEVDEKDNDDDDDFLTYTDIYIKIEELSETNLTKTILLTPQETNLLWKAFNWSFRAIVPIRGGELIVPERTPCLRIITDVDSKMGRCSVFDFNCLLVKDDSHIAKAKIYPYFIEPGERNSELCEIIENILKKNNLFYEARVWNTFKTVGEGFYNWRWDTYVHGKTEKKYFKGVPQKCYRY